jgi:hypothetical protein
MPMPVAAQPPQPPAAAAAMPMPVAAQPPQPPAAAAADAAPLTAARPGPSGGTKRARDGDDDGEQPLLGLQPDSGERTGRVRKPSSRYDV